MTQFLKIEKNGDIKNSKISDINELYKKCGFRKNTGFEKITNWEKNIDGNNINIELWGRTSGKNNFKNNYTFPESFNKSIYGNCSLIHKQNDKIIDLSEELWNKMHIVGEKLSIPSGCDFTPTTPVENILTAEEVEEVEEDEEEDIISISDDDDYSNSELEEESYLYSSEGEKQ